jgi:hypothetical protein
LSAALKAADRFVSCFGSSRQTCSVKYNNIKMTKKIGLLGLKVAIFLPLYIFIITTKVTRLGEFSPNGRLFTLASF